MSSVAALRSIRRDDRRRHHWMLTAENVDASERYFLEVDTSGGQKAGAAAVEEAKRRSRQSRRPC